MMITTFRKSIHMNISPIVPLKVVQLNMGCRTSFGRKGGVYALTARAPNLEVLNKLKKQLSLCTYLH